VVRAVAGEASNVAVLAGILAPDTTSALDAARAARQAGAQALLLLTPYYIAPSLEGIVDHFRLVADAVDLPILIYNNPGRTGTNLELSALERLAEIPAVVGIKECDRDLGRVAGKIARLGERLAFLSGDDDLLLPFLSLGGKGAIMASTNLVAEWVVRLFEAVQEEDWEQARDIFLGRLLPFVMLYKGPDHPGPLKQAMALAGLDVGLGRPPLRPLDDRRLMQMSQALEALGLRKER
jgi:4-hydroxy-tetrahydrodipicolinate synthase